MSDHQLLTIASASVYASQDFTRATEDWERLLPAAKTWAAWKIAYLRAHRERARLLQAQGGNIGSANAALSNNRPGLPAQSASRIESYLDNLANAATQDTQQLALLVESNHLLSAQVAALTSRLAANVYNPVVPPGVPPGVPPIGPIRATRTPLEKLIYRIKVKTYDPTGYCSTHGYMVGKSHTSVSCNNKKTGHNDGATRANIMGGKEYNKGWEVGWQNI